MIELSILHVDDEPDFAELTAEFLQREDERLEVMTATSADEGLDYLDEEAVDCVVSDYQMPRMDGIEFLETVREEHPDLPFILFTGQGSEEVASEAIAAGVTDYLQKDPGTHQFELLANRITNAVERTQALEQTSRLERIRTLVRDVNQALLRASGRSAVESRVCETVTEPEPYRLAMIAAPGSEDEGIKLRTAVSDKGPVDGDIDRFDDESPLQETIETALQERKLAVSEIDTESEAGCKRADLVKEHDVRSVAAAPLVFDRDSFGVFVVCAGRSFTAREQDLLDELADDITHALDALETRTELTEERNRRSALFENTPDPIIEVEFDDETPIITDLNAGFEETFGFETADAIGQPVDEVVVPETERDEHETLKQRVFEGESIETEVRRETATGVREFRLRIIPIDVEDVSSSAYAWYTDISERKERERELRETKERFQKIFEHSNDAILIIDPNNGAIRDANTRACEMLGYDREELLSLSPADIHPHEIDRFQEFVETVYEGGAGQTNELSCLTKEGDRIPAEVSASVIELDDSRNVLAIVRDISERKERERELREAKERFQKIFEHSNDAIMVVDMEEETFLNVNPAACEMLGYEREELLALEPGDIHPANIDRVREEFISQVLSEGAGWTDELECVTKDGDVVPTEISGAVLELDPDEDDPTTMVAALRDISDREEYRQELERQVEHLDEFASIVSHDLRNPLNVAKGRLELLRDEYDIEHLDDIKSALDRMNDIIERTLTLARSGQAVGDTEPVELTEVIEQCVQHIETTNIDLRVEDAPTVIADPDRLQHVLENLCQNANAHSGKDVTVEIGRLADGFYVADDGPGIPESERDDVFEAGYSSTADGTGLGLAIVQKIISAHGWDIEITESEMGGTRFEITGVTFAAE